MSAILTWLLVLMTALLCVGIWIGPALIAVGVVLLELFTNRPTTKLIGAWTFNGTEPDGEPVRLAAKNADVLRRREDGTWRFVIDNPWGTD